MNSKKQGKPKKRRIGARLTSVIVIFICLTLISYIFIFTPTIPVIKKTDSTCTTDQCENQCENCTDDQCDTCIKEEESGSGYLGLFRPPASIVSVYGDAPEIPTAQVSLFGWENMTDDYGTITNWDIYDSVGAFENYTDYGNAVEGYVYIQQHCPNAPVGGGENVSVTVRVRSDAVIVGWIKESQTDTSGERGSAYVRFWECKSCQWYNFEAHHTTIARAIEIVVEDYMDPTYGASQDLPANYTKINYYDYEFPSATRLYFFGFCEHQWSSGTTFYMYFTIEASASVVNALAIHGGGCTSSCCSGGTLTQYSLNDVVKSQYGPAGGSWGYGWYGIDITSDIPTGQQHTIKGYTSCGGCASSWGLWNTFAALIWTS